MIVLNKFGIMKEKGYLIMSIDSGLYDLVKDYVLKMYVIFKIIEKYDVIIIFEFFYMIEYNY